jgi:hypothetical protein
VTVLDTEAIRQYVLHLEARRSEAQREVAVANRVLEGVDRELSLLRELLRLRSSAELEPSAEDFDASQSAAGEAIPLYARSDSSRLVDEVAGILKESESPLPIRVIYDELKNRGIPLPGQGRMVNVIAAIRRSELIARPARGVYALRAWAAANEGTASEGGSTPVGHPKPRRRRGGAKTRASRS